MKPLAIDTETFLITCEKASPKNVCLTWATETESGILKHGLKLVDQLFKWIDDPKIFFVGHFVAFDFCSLCTSYPELTPYIFALYKDNRVTDIGIRQQLFDIAIGKIYNDEEVSGYSLAYLYETIFGKKSPNFESKVKDNPDSWRLKYNELYDVSLKDWPQDALDYAIQDAEITFDIYQEQAEAKNYFRDDSFQAYAQFCLHWITINGMVTSPSKVILLEREQKRIYEKFAVELEQYSLIEKQKDGSYTKKKFPTQKLIYKSCQEKNIDPLLTKKGKEILEHDGELDDKYKYLATDKKAIYWSGNELLLKRIKLSEAEKILTTYIPILKRGYEFPVRSRFGLASTGRTTSKAPKPPLIGTNYQNWPRKTKARNCHIPREGNLYLSGDFSGAELHAHAQSCKELLGYSTLGDILNEGKDVHLYVASVIMGISYNEALKRKDEKEIKKERFNAKMANFGFLGGMMPDTWIMNQLDRTGHLYSKKFATRLRNHWLKAFPEMKAYLNHCRKLLKINNFDLVLEAQYSKRLRKIMKYTVLANDYFQSRTADGAKKAICAVINKCYCDKNSYLYDCLPVNFIHDQLILEISDIDDLDFRNELIKEFKQTMEDEFNDVVPDYPTTIDIQLMDCWNKEVKEIIDENGYWRVVSDG